MTRRNKLVALQADMKSATFWHIGQYGIAQSRAEHILPLLGPSRRTQLQELLRQGSEQEQALTASLTTLSEQIDQLLADGRLHTTIYHSCTDAAQTFIKQWQRRESEPAFGLHALADNIIALVTAERDRSTTLESDLSSLIADQVSLKQALDRSPDSHPLGAGFSALDYEIQQAITHWALEQTRPNDEPRSWGASFESIERARSMLLGLADLLMLPPCNQIRSAHRHADIVLQVGLLNAHITRLRPRFNAVKTLLEDEAQTIFLTLTAMRRTLKRVDATRLAGNFSAAQELIAWIKDEQDGLHDLIDDLEDTARFSQAAAEQAALHREQRLIGCHTMAFAILAQASAIAPEWQNEITRLIDAVTHLRERPSGPSDSRRILEAEDRIIVIGQKLKAIEAAIQADLDAETDALLQAELASTSSKSAPT